MDVNTLIISLDEYNSWLEDGLCLNFENGTLITEAQRYDLAFDEMKMLWPDEVIEEDDVYDYISDNIGDFPKTIEEFEEYVEVSYISYTSKSGDEIVIINWVYN